MLCSTLNKETCSFKPLNVTEGGFLQPAATSQVRSLDAGKPLMGRWIRAIYRRTETREESRSTTGSREGRGAGREERKVRKILLRD